MRRLLSACAAAAALLLALPAPLPAQVPGTETGIEPAEVPRRFVPRPAGVRRDMTFYFGPFTIPPGQDLNRVTIDLPVHGGFITAVAPNLIDVTTGVRPSNQHMHIHHAHWLRITTDPDEEYYSDGLSWVFGTGEERTQGSVEDRAAADPNGPQYGIFIKGGQPQALIYMLHNKTPLPANVFVTLDVTFVYGTQAEIVGASDCGPVLLDGETCMAGKDYHPLTGKLWGNTFDVPRQRNGDDLWNHPVDRGRPLGITFEANWDATVIAGAGHLHPMGREVVIANLGPAGSGCQADVDGDGLPGTTIFRSQKIERVPEAFPKSEDYQMGATKFGFRAPIHKGDRIAQFGLYANRDHASYEAMSFTGIYVDKLQPPPPATGCNVESYGSYLIDDPAGNPLETVQNHEWDSHHADPVCGEGVGAACETNMNPAYNVVDADTVHVAGFLYTPGDQSHGVIPRIRQGSSLRFINEDTAGLIRHTVTSCPWPCNGAYVANYPLPDGAFDSGKLGNLDYIDGGIRGDDTVPLWETPPNLPVGKYSFYCRIHPWMRGAFEVTA